MQLTPYIIFNGNCEEALNFYAKVFGGRIDNLMHYEGSPAEGMAIDKKNVLHAHFSAGDFMLMASDTGQGGGTSPDSGMVHLSMNVDTPEKQDALFNALKEGGKVTQPLQDTFWGARFGMLTDRYGVKWMFNCEKSPAK